MSNSPAPIHRSAQRCRLGAKHLALLPVKIPKQSLRQAWAVSLGGIQADRLVGGIASRGLACDQLPELTERYGRLAVLPRGRQVVECGPRFPAPATRYSGCSVGLTHSKERSHSFSSSSHSHSASCRHTALSGVSAAADVSRDLLGLVASGCRQACGVTMAHLGRSGSSRCR